MHNILFASTIEVIMALWPPGGVLSSLRHSIRGRACQEAGFTLIEILIVIGIIAVLAGIVIVAINPAKQFAQARNTQRQANVNTILNAIGQRLSDNKGTFEGTFAVGSPSVSYTCGPIPSATTTITTTMAADTTSPTGSMGCLVPTYIATMPFDPAASSTSNTAYSVLADSTGRITVCSGMAATETSIPGAAAICVKR